MISAFGCAIHEENHHFFAELNSDMNDVREKHVNNYVRRKV